jgi:thiol-disulfide isomerase/thioredoxin
MKLMYRCMFGLCVLVAMTATGLAQQAAQQEDPFSGVVLQVPPLQKGSAGAAMAQWSTGAAVPKAKKYHTVAFYDGNMYIFGGVTTGNYYDSLCYKYNVATDTWSRIKDFPTLKYLFGTAQAINGKIYITGGLSNIGTAFAAVRDMFVYDPATDTYTKKTAMPSPQGFAASGVIDNRMYVIAGSGTNTTFTQVVQVYDPATDLWSQETNYPKACRYLSGTTVNNTIIVSGGYNNTWSNMYYTADTYVGTSTGGTLTWTKVKDYPIGPTIYMSSATAGTKAVFFGGRPSIDNNAPATQRSFWYEPATDTWTTCELKPTGMQTMLQAAGDGRYVYAPGGEDATGAALSVLEIFDTQAATSPVLYMTQRSVDVWAKIGGTITTGLPMKNNGTAPLTWSATVDAGASSWLSLQKTSGTLAVMAQENLTVVVNASALTTGDHNATVTLTTNDPGNATVTIPVAVHAQPEDVDEDLHVLMEEFSGNWCTFCPQGADTLRLLEALYGDRLNVITYHGANNDPMITAVGDSVISLLRVTAYPMSVINRIMFADQTTLQVGRGYWRDELAYVFANRRSPISISVSNKNYNPATKVLSMRVTVFAHQTIDASSLRLSVVQAEDSLNWRQYSSGAWVYPYFHLNAVRAMWPNALGEPLGVNSLVTQTSIVKDITMQSADSAAKNASITIFVHRMVGGAPGEVLQSYKETLLSNATAAEPPAIVADFALAQNYPNPFNPSTTIAYDVPRSTPVAITVADGYGRVVATLVNGMVEAGRHTATFNAEGFASGSYFVTMRAGGFVATRIMTLMK